MKLLLILKSCQYRLACKLPFLGLLGNALRRTETREARAEVQRTFGGDPRAATIAAHQFVLRRRTLLVRSCYRALSRDVERFNYLAKKLEVRPDTGIDDHEGNADQRGDDQVLQSASSFIT